MIEYRDYIKRAMLKAEPEKLFVFGDNFARMGFGGQAKEMRGEPNAVGIPTKRNPTMLKGAFLRDEDIGEWYRKVGPDIVRLLDEGIIIVWPTAGIGTGLARLEETAPLIFKKIEALKSILE